MNAGIGLATWRHRKGSPCWIYKTFETIKLEIFEILSGVLWVHEGQSDKMPNEGRKEYLKILGVDNCSSESRFYHGYHALCNYGVYCTLHHHHFRLESGQWNPNFWRNWKPGYLRFPLQVTCFISSFYEIKYFPVSLTIVGYFCRWN